jgi:hypothetical protein
MAQYQNGVSEIRMRLEAEESLFRLKFTVVGAIMGALLTAVAGLTAPPSNGSPTTVRRWAESPVFLVVIWAAVVCSTLLDARVGFNANAIQEQGSWIQRVVEPYMLGSTNATGMVQYPEAGVMGWEKYIVSESNLFNSNSYFVLRAHVYALTAILIIAAAMYSRWLIAHVEKKQAFRLLGYSTLATWCALAMAALTAAHNRFSDHRYVWYVAAAFVLAAVSTRAIYQIAYTRSTHR